ncbi:MAG: CgeB family protein, partial [Bacteriovoracaceae bacterium]|nr:CgeB family protein [Bacteriovoracaceae bacterium]
MKICILRGPNEPVYESLKQALESHHHLVQIFSIDQKTPLLDLTNALEKFRPDFCLTINFYVFDEWYSGGRELEGYLESKSIPVGSIYWDAPWASGTYSLLDRMNKGPFSKNILFLVIDRAHEEFFLKRGVKALFLRSAVDVKFSQIVPSEELSRKFSFPVSYVGSPIKQIFFKVQSEQRLHDIYIRIMQGELGIWLENSASLSKEEAGRETEIVRPFVSQFLRDFHHDAESFEKSENIFYGEVERFLRPASYVTFERFRARVEFLYSWMQLHTYLVRLLPEDLRVFGGNEWSEFLLPGYSHSSPRLTNEELSACFKNSKINFCLTKWQFRTAVHEKPLQILLSNGFPLTDDRSDLKDYFAQGEIISYRSFEEAKDL